MPTGYTSSIHDGKCDNAKDYLITCARAFGATVEIRDEPLNKTIPEFKPSTYHLEEMEKAKEKLQRYKKMSLEEAQKEVDYMYERNVKENNEYKKEKLELKERYIKVLNEVKSWGIPTLEHTKLKEFAIQQLVDSIDWDCDTSYYDKKVIKMDAKEWLNCRISGCLKDIEYHAKGYREEVERVNKNNKWIKDLKDSL